MGTTKKPRKAYRPRREPLLNTLTYVLARLRPADGPTKNRTQCRYHGALTSMVKGKGAKADWQDLAEALNMTVLIAEKGFGVEHMEFLLDCQRAMYTVRDRYHERGSMVPTGLERKMFIQALDLHDQQLDMVAAGTIEDAYQEMQRRIARGNLVSPALPERQLAA